MDEFERIATLRNILRSDSAGVLLGMGDDAAVLARPEHNAVWTVDTAVEDVHFRARFADWSTIGARAFSAAVSDLAAMGAQPTAALVSLILPAAFGDEDFAELQRGIADAAARYACPVVGGNLARGRELSITTSALGQVRGVGLTRSGARPGDTLHVTGVLGAAALGFAILEAASAADGDERESWLRCVEHWRAPRARIAEGRALVDVASAAIDVSDGALQDLGHLCRASEVGAQLEAEALPLVPGFADLARALNQDPLRLALTGGEDYELLFTLPSTAPDSARAIGTCIGRVTAQVGALSVLDAHGRELPVDPIGYRHFG